MRAKQYKIKISKAHRLQANNGTWYTNGKLAILSSLTDQNVRGGEVFYNGQKASDPVQMPDINLVLPQQKGEEFSEICGIVGEISAGNYARFLKAESGKVVAIDIDIYNEISAAAFPTCITWAGIKDSGAYHPVAFWSGEELTAVLMPVEFKGDKLEKALTLLKNSLA